MAQNVISTAILIIAAVVAVVALINGVFPAIYQMSGSMSSVSDMSNDRMNTEIRIIYVSANQSRDHAINVYVKNTGMKSVPGPKIKNADVFYGTASTGMSKAVAGGTPPGPVWDYTIMEGNGDINWDPGETLNIRLSTDSCDFTNGRQQVRFVLANGVSDRLEYTLL